jgi:DNA-binding GntR family transcriptional regulator
MPLAKAGPAPSNVDVAVEALRDAIVDGRLKPGERLKEIPLAAQLGVSRGPIRDALRLLERDGLIDVIPNRGAVVPELHALDVLEVYALRASLGSLALQKLVLEDTLPIGELERSLRGLRSAVERTDARRAGDHDLGYQSAILAGSGLPRAAREFERLTWQVRSFMTALDINYDDKLPRIRDEVEALHAAIISRNARDAEALWREKYGRWVRNLVELLPEPFDEALWTALTSGRPG